MGGTVAGLAPKFKDEGNTATAGTLEITLGRTPDLVVSEVDAPEHATVGQAFDFSYTVLNQGGDTTPLQGSWTDSVYLSRDAFLDISSDRYIGSFDHTGGLAAAQQYSVP